MFTICTDPRNGFQITFENGYTVSVQFGEGNYCSFESTKECKNAEVALISPDGWLMDLSGKFDWWSFTDEVNGYTTPDEVAELIAYAQALPAK